MPIPLRKSQYFNSFLVPTLPLCRILMLLLLRLVFNLGCSAHRTLSRSLTGANALGIGIGSDKLLKANRSCTVARVSWQRSQVA